MKSRFDAFEVHSVKMVDGGDSTYDCFEQCEEDNPGLYAWAVYGHVPDEGLECLADCPSKKAAELVKRALEIACFKHRALVSVAKTVTGRWERGELAEAVRKLDAAIRCNGLNDEISLHNDIETASGIRHE